MAPSSGSAVAVNNPLASAVTILDPVPESVVIVVWPVILTTGSELPPLKESVVPFTTKLL